MKIHPLKSWESRWEAQKKAEESSWQGEERREKFQCLSSWITFKRKRDSCKNSLYDLYDFYKKSNKQSWPESYNKQDFSFSLFDIIYFSCKDKELSHKNPQNSSSKKNLTSLSSTISPSKIKLTPSTPTQQAKPSSSKKKQDYAEGTIKSPKQQEAQKRLLRNWKMKFQVWKNK